MEAKEKAPVSPRHAKPIFALRRPRLFAGVLGVATAGATAIGLIVVPPAESAQTSSITGVRASLDRPADDAQIRIPGKGILTARKAKRSMPTASDAVSLAVAQVGISENAYGGGTKFQKWFVSSPVAEQDARRDGGSVNDYADASWCDMFVSWVGHQLGVKGMGADAFTPRHARWFQKQGRWGTTPRPGAIVFYAWNGGGIGGIDHVGMVIKDNHNGTIKTVEGNTDDAVRIRTRDTSSVVGYGYPQYAN
jgi:cell wall-associated NlpC family hydrolase